MTLLFLPSSFAVTQSGHSQWRTVLSVWGHLHHNVIVDEVASKLTKSQSCLLEFWSICSVVWSQYTIWWHWYWDAAKHIIRRLYFIFARSVSVNWKFNWTYVNMFGMAIALFTYSLNDYTRKHIYNNNTRHTS